MDKFLESLNKKLASERILKIIDLVRYRRGRTSFYPISSSLLKTNSFFLKVLTEIYNLLTPLPSKTLIFNKIKTHTNPIIYYSIIENQINVKYFRFKEVIEKEISLKIPFGDLKIFTEKEYIFNLSIKEGLNLRWYRMFNPRDGFKKISWSRYKQEYLSINKVDLGNIKRWRIEPFGYIIKMPGYFYYLFPSNPVARLNKSTVDGVLKVIRETGKEEGWFNFPVFGRSFLIKTKKINIQPSMPVIEGKVNIDYNKYLDTLAKKIASKENLKNIIKKITIEGLEGKNYVINL